MQPFISRMSGDVGLGWFRSTRDRWLPQETTEARAVQKCSVEIGTPTNGNALLQRGSTTRLSRARGTTEAIGIQHVLQCQYSFQFMDIGTADHWQNVELRLAHSFEGQIQGLVGM